MVISDAWMYPYGVCADVLQHEASQQHPQGGRQLDLCININVCMTLHTAFDYDSLIDIQIVSMALQPAARPSGRVYSKMFAVMYPAVLPSHILSGSLYATAVQLGHSFLQSMHPAGELALVTR